MGITGKARSGHEMFRKGYECVEMASWYSYAGRTEFWIEIYVTSFSISLSFKMFELQIQMF
jgi:hypothetical protein